MVKKSKQGVFFISSIKTYIQRIKSVLKHYSICHDTEGKYTRTNCSIKILISSNVLKLLKHGKLYKVDQGRKDLKNYKSSTSNLFEVEINWTVALRMNKLLVMSEEPFM